MVAQQEIERWLLALPGVWLDYPFGDNVGVYKVGEKGRDDSPMFALIQEGSSPVRLSLRCDPQLAVVLREKYETILPGDNLSKRHWNTIICSGQVGDEELGDLIRHSYELVR